MKKGFATSAILYTLLLLFLVLMVNILNNLQNKKVILDALKEDTINALQQDIIMDTILEQIGILNNQMVEIQQRIEDMNTNIPTKVSQLENDTGFITLPFTSFRVNNLEEFKTYCINSVPNGVTLWHLNVNGAVYGVIVQKANSKYFSFIIFNYFNFAAQYQYVDGTWATYNL